MADPWSAEDQGPVNGHGDVVPQGTVRSQKCSARRTDGAPCRKWAIVGGTVCTTHGGSAPQVREAARRRIMQGVLPALAEADRMIHDPEVKDATRARLIIDLLDRAGLKPTDVLIHARADEASDAPDLDAAIRDALERRQLLPGGSSSGDQADDVVDAEVLED